MGEFRSKGFAHIEEEGEEAGIVAVLGGFGGGGGKGGGCLLYTSRCV